MTGQMSGWMNGWMNDQLVLEKVSIYVSYVTLCHSSY